VPAALDETAVSPIHPDFGAIIVGVDFSAPMTDQAITDIQRLADTYAVLVFRNAAAVGDADQLEFCRRLGPGPILGIERPPMAAGLLPGVIALRNLDDDGEIVPLDDRRNAFRKANELWHTDESFSFDRGAYSILKAVELPPDGAAPTEFTDMRSVVDDLPDSLIAQLLALTAVHSLPYSLHLSGYEALEADYERWPSSIQPLVNHNTRTGRRSLYLAKHIKKIVGLDDDESELLLADLFDRARRAKNFYRHTWSPNDIVLWDNLATMHRATSFESSTMRREMRRTTSLELAGTY
jgi:alpha-ketoglutarate-dependent 2,4-dichlorophenoxyacetate dioxygenase